MCGRLFRRLRRFNCGVGIAEWGVGSGGCMDNGGLSGQVIVLAPEDVREALRLIRAIRLAEDQVQAMRHQQEMFEAQLATVYGAPAGWVLRDFTVGFEPPGA